MIATIGEIGLEAWYHDHKLEFVPNAYQEDGELLDTYNVQRCKAISAESTYLASARRDGGVNRLKSRFIPDHIESFPVLAATPLSADPQWAAIVAWTIYTLVNADAVRSDYHAGGPEAMAIEEVGLGLPKGWQANVVETVGSYSKVFRRTLGMDSPLKLEQGLNRRLADGGVLVTPAR